MILSIFKRANLYYRINGIIIGVILVLSLIIGVLMVRITRSLMERQLENRGIEIATSIGASSSNDILLDDHYALSSRITASRNHADDLKYIIICDFAGREMIDTFLGKFPAGLPQDINPIALPASAESSEGEPAPRVTTYASNEGPIREVTVPIEKGAIGYVRVGMSGRTSQKLLRATIRRFLLITLVICLLASAGATVLAHLIVKPIHRLVAAAHQIRKGNYSVRAEVRDDAEVGHLAQAFNEMAASLKAEAIEHDRLLEELRKKEAARAILLNKLFSAQEDERKRISRELHDESGQSLASMLAYLKLLSSTLTTEPQKELLLQARNVVTEIMGNLRAMAVELRPPVLDDLGILTAMQKYIDHFRRQQGCAVVCRFPDHEPRLDGTVSLALYRILQESLVNVAKHARAKTVHVLLAAQERQITLSVSDDGQGASQAELAQAFGNNRLGIFGMQERAELLGGSFSMVSDPQRGTTVKATLPPFLG
ncbi:MAG: HAMP domain-containing protein [Holophaga sp.]|nr:HAMP domain-containing protein [Holophaga sp.]